TTPSGVEHQLDATSPNVGLRPPGGGNKRLAPRAGSGFLFFGRAPTPKSCLRSYREPKTDS
ncbi:MAG: hypothetical protein WAM81_02865, partial [Acidimicrobiia bacterium]